MCSTNLTKADGRLLLHEKDYYMLVAISHGEETFFYLLALTLLLLHFVSCSYSS